MMKSQKDNLILIVCRRIGLSLFTFMNFVGAFKEESGVAFGQGSIVGDPTFLTVVAIVFLFLIVFFLSSNDEKKE